MSKGGRMRREGRRRGGKEEKKKSEWGEKVREDLCGL